VSESLLFNANSAIYQLYYGENKLIINEMMMKSTLFYRTRGEHANHYATDAVLLIVVTT
jgi:hypothetical protein